MQSDLRCNSGRGIVHLGKKSKMNTVSRPVTDHQLNEYVLRGTTSIVLGDSQLKIARIALPLFAILALVAIIVVYSMGHHNFPKWIIPTAVTLTIVCSVGSIVTLFFKKREIKEIPSPNTRPPLSDIHLAEGDRLQALSDFSPEQSALLDELCERNQQGCEVTCSTERCYEILTQFERGGGLAILNTIPKCCRNHSWKFSCRAHVPYTALHYWAKKGNLSIVEMLVEKGAKDYFSSGKNSYQLYSALQVAALCGHLPVVQYLLKNESHVDIAFVDKNVLRCFVPQLIFLRACNIRITGGGDECEFDSFLQCLDMILNALMVKNPINLQFQLNIPIEEGQNAFVHIEKVLLAFSHNERKREKLTMLKELLIRYGAAKDERAYTVEELRAAGHNIGIGFTLAHASQLK